uniref:Uncharacterized protein n=1 Tax=viral metagenome TaxID=1070528 RepID=A0A6M3MA13_9ZZZZ
MRSVQYYRQQVDKKKARKELLEQQFLSREEEIGDKKAQAEKVTKARWVLSEVARLTQEKFKGYVESLVTMAIRSIFDRPYEFLVDFEIKRNKSECYLRVREGDWEPYVPKDEQGGGIIDVISFALRVVLWSLQKPRSRNVIILDEPMKNMGDLIFLGGQMLREISHRLGFQLLIVTHEKELVNIADRAWEVRHNGESSEVKLLGGEDIQKTIPIKEKRKDIKL